MTQEENFELPARHTLQKQKISELSIGNVAVYFRDGEEHIWIKSSKTHHYQAEVVGSRWKQIAADKVLDPEEEVYVIQNQEITAGSEFAIEVSDTVEIDEIRERAREDFGREIHIRAQIGPWEVVDGKLTCPLKAIDDGALMGQFNQFPQTKGCYLLVGYLK